MVRRPSQLSNGHSRVQRSVQEHSLPQALRHHRTHSIESAPDDLLSPKSQIEEAKAATLLHTPIQNAFSLPSACDATHWSCTMAALAGMSTSQHGIGPYKGSHIGNR